MQLVLFLEMSADGAYPEPRILWALLFNSQERQKVLQLIIFCWLSGLCRLRIDIKHDPLSSKTLWYRSGVFAQNYKRWIMVQGQFLESVRICCPTLTALSAHITGPSPVFLRHPFTERPFLGKIATTPLPYTVILESLFLARTRLALSTYCLSLHSRAVTQELCACLHS